MDLNLSDEQRLLRESVDRFIAETYDADHRRRSAGDPLGFSPAIWKQFADLGWLALPIAEEYGGLGAGSVETGIVMEAFGRGLVTEPYLATVIIGAGLISECGSEAQKQAMLPKVADGSLHLAFAHSERAARFDLAHVDTVATKTADGWRLDGKKIAVIDGRAAGQIIVSARVADNNGAAGKLCLFLMPAGTQGITPRDYARLGGGRACNLDLANVQLPANALLGDGSDALPRIEAVVDRALAALGSEAVGIMQIMFDMTLEYTKVRQQFGRPLSANQVIRHRLADMAMHCDEARSIALRAAVMADAEPVARGRAASGAKAKIGKSARFVAEQSVQLHGAMGVTEELDIGSYFKRLLAFDTLFGGSAHHYRRHAALGGRTPPHA
ncbi:MAG: acyl-CoA dehydrogenase [Bradyrhizobium sp.]|nr:acyl-CoA dehydrogenase [Bradyrhizobium sp.]